jgi:hypothetical protein
MPRQEALAGPEEPGTDSLNVHISICDLHPCDFAVFLVSHKFVVQTGDIEFTLPDEGELKK